ncbi:peptide ABC transporter substrate-binding protein [Tumebacillus lipolyticus]|uniref:Peptide ABC transporter substrate-binding protein n=1 Tax=Tumebacillus lipolyticus TaxID=1280370 RepID=A0ABW4ZZP6_9BACL
MRAKKWLTIGLSCSLLSGVLIGCSSSETGESGKDKDSQDQQILNLVLSDELPTMDVSKATDNLAFTLFSNVNEGLVRLDKDGKASEGLAEKWEISKDGLTYTFHLRDNIKWSNGDPVTAQDFEYSWKRTLNPDTGAQYAFMVGWVKGGQAYNEGKGKVEDVGVKALDEKTLEVKLENPLPFFIEQMAFPTFFAQNQKFVEASGDKYGSEKDKILFNGPFTMTDWTHEQSVTLQKNDSYWDRDKVKLEQVFLQIVKDSNAAVNLYEAGQVDRTSLMRDQVDNYKGKPDYAEQPELATGYLSYNQSVKALQSAKVRQALTWAVDWETYADVIYHNGSKAPTGFTPFGTSDGQGGEFAKNVGDLLKLKENRPKAKETLAAGLKEVGVSSFPTLKLMVDEGDAGRKSGEFIQEQWRKNLGITVEIDPLPFKLRLQKSREHNFDISLGVWIADYNDPMTFLDLLVTDGGINYGGWSNKEYDALIKKAQQEPDTKRRISLLQDAEKLLIQEMPIAPNNFRARAYVTKPYVKNFLWRPFAIEYDLKETYIEGKK